MTEHPTDQAEPVSAVNDDARQSLITEILDHAPGSLTRAEHVSLTAFALTADTCTRIIPDGDITGLLQAKFQVSRSRAQAIILALVKKGALVKTAPAVRGERPAYTIADLQATSTLEETS